MALPWAVLDSASYAALSHPARSLLLEIARQYVRDNNGRLLASRAYLATRGWNSAAVIDRAKHELLDAGFIFETVKGHRPNKASWHAVTWHALDRLPGYDPGAIESFERGAYRKSPCPVPSRGTVKNASLSPSGGTERTPIGPSRGTESPRTVPSRGPIEAISGDLSVPPERHHLEKPSASGIPACSPLTVRSATPAPERMVA